MRRIIRTNIIRAKCISAFYYTNSYFCGICGRFAYYSVSMPAKSEHRIGANLEYNEDGKLVMFIGIIKYFTKSELLF